MIKILLASSLATLAMGAASPADPPAAASAARAEAGAPAMAVCVAGLEIALGAQSGPVRLSLSETLGRCGCPDCALAALRLEMAGLTLRI